MSEVIEESVIDGKLNKILGYIDNKTHIFVIGDLFPFESLLFPKNGKYNVVRVRFSKDDLKRSKKDNVQIVSGMFNMAHITTSLTGRMKVFAVYGIENLGAIAKTYLFENIIKFSMYPMILTIPNMYEIDKKYRKSYKQVALPNIKNDEFIVSKITRDVLVSTDRNLVYSELVDIEKIGYIIKMVEYNMSVFARIFNDIYLHDVRILPLILKFLHKIDQRFVAGMMAYTIRPFPVTNLRIQGLWNDELRMEADEKKKQIAPHKCPRCGAETTAEIVCSQCSKQRGSITKDMKNKVKSVAKIRAKQTSGGIFG